MLFITEYVDQSDGFRYEGNYIEAESFDQAEQQAKKIAQLESMQAEPKFAELKVLGTLEAVIPFEENLAHAASQVCCKKCSHLWTAVHPAGIDFVQCRCGAWNAIYDA